MEVVTGDPKSPKSSSSMKPFLAVGGAGGGRPSKKGVEFGWGVVVEDKVREGGGRGKGKEGEAVVLMERLGGLGKVGTR